MKYKGTEIYSLMESMLGNRGAQARAYCGLGAGQPWCNAQVTYAFAMEDAKTLYCNGRRETYCPHSIQWCYANLADIPIYLALEGDVIYFDWERNGTPNHIGFVRSRVSDVQIDTVEGNTSGGKVANKTREGKYVQAVFRPHYHVPKSEYDVSKPLVIDGQFGFNSIACLQKALMLHVDAILGKDTVKALQRLVGVTADGSWGTKTTKAVQKMVDVKVDGFCGAKTVKGLQKWINKQLFTEVTKPVKKETWEDKTIAYGKKLANDAKAGYRKFNGKDKSTQECLICHPETDPNHKWYKYTGNCIWFTFACLHHGGGLKCKCSCHVIDNALGTKLLKMSKTEAIRAWEKATGLKGWKCIKNNGGIPDSKLKKADVIIFYDENDVYYHIGLYAGGGKIIDCGNWSDKSKQIAVRSYNQSAVKLAFRYIGK